MRSRRGSSVLRGLPVSSRIPEPTAEAFAALPGNCVGVCRTAGRLFIETLFCLACLLEKCFGILHTIFYPSVHCHVV